MSSWGSLAKPPSMGIRGAALDPLAALPSRRGRGALKNSKLGGRNMTLEEVKRSDKAFLLPKDIAPILGSDEQTIRVSARLGVLGFPVTFVGNRLKIPRLPFLRFIGEA